MWKSILGATALAGWMGAASAQPLDPGAELEFMPLAAAAMVAPAMEDLETVSFSIVVMAERIVADAGEGFSPIAVAATVEDTFATASVVSEGELDGMAGGTAVLDDAQLNDASTSGYSANNSVGDYTQTGQITGANISDMSGFSTIMMNTGNNVVMQSTTQVNIILK